MMTTITQISVERLHQSIEAWVRTKQHLLFLPSPYSYAAEWTYCETSNRFMIRLNLKISRFEWSSAVSIDASNNRPASLPLHEQHSMLQEALLRAKPLRRAREAG